jgi:hypothetical protein
MGMPQSRPPHYNGANTNNADDHGDRFPVKWDDGPLLPLLRRARPPSLLTELDIEERLLFERRPTFPSALADAYRNVTNL